jgi:hypothetical protein
MLAEQKAGSSAAVIRAHSAGHPWPAGDPPHADANLHHKHGGEQSCCVSTAICFSPSAAIISPHSWP